MLSCVLFEYGGRHIPTCVAKVYITMKAEHFATQQT